jgi:hypothetical protein
LGEFSSVGRLFILGRFLKITKVANFVHGTRYTKKITINRLG